MPCIEWPRCRPDGYGYLYIGGKQIRAHRYVWEQAHGPIPKGMKILHSCDNPPCVNLEHLFLGTSADNSRDMVRKGRNVPCVRFGSANGRSKLTEEQRAEIARSAKSRQELAVEFGVSFPTIHRIKRRYKVAKP